MTVSNPIAKPDPSRFRERVAFSAVESARRVIFSRLEHLPDAKRAKLANALAAELRDLGVLDQCVERCYSAAALAALWGRCAEWVIATFAPRPQPGSAIVDGEFRGAYGPVYRDDASWLIPASTANAYLAAHVFSGSTQPFGRRRKAA